VPRHVTWTNYRGIGETVAEARPLYQKMKDSENSGAYAAEYRRLQDERIAAFGEYLEDVKSGSFPDFGNLIETDPEVLEAVKKGI